jgi:hypothetical protein
MIEAKDYQRYETAITVRTGETLPHNATLVEMAKLPPPTPTGPPISVEGTVTTKSESNIWKPVFISAAALDAVAWGFTIYEWQTAKSNAGKIDPRGNFVNSMNHQLGQADCDKSAVVNYVPVPPGDAKDAESLKHFKDACSNYSLQRVGWVVSSVVGVAVVGSFIMAFFRERDHGEAATASAGHKKRRELAITPIVTPDGGGATLRIDW